MGNHLNYTKNGERNYQKHSCSQKNGGSTQLVSCFWKDINFNQFDGEILEMAVRISVIERCLTKAIWRRWYF